MKYQLIRDPEFERFVPPLTEKEREELEASILSEGCRDAIVVWNNTILDGHNRYEICLRHSLPFEIRTVHMESRDEAIAWICTNQMCRRNITEETRRYLIGKRYEAEKRIGARNASGTNQYTKSEVSPRMLGKAPPDAKHGLAGTLGKEYRMSHTTIEKYGRYAQAVDRIAAVEPRVIPHILSGAVHIGQDNMIDMGKLTDRQIKAVTESIPYNSEYHLNRNDIIRALQRDRKSYLNQAPVDIPEVRLQSVKDMPEYDPDAEISSLILTIPSWSSSIERVRTTARMENVSSTAKEGLRRELQSLMRQIDEMFSSIQEG